MSHSCHLEAVYDGDILVRNAEPDNHSMAISFSCFSLRQKNSFRFK
jgi:hypothetical protein